MKQAMQPRLIPLQIGQTMQLHPVCIADIDEPFIAGLCLLRARKMSIIKEDKNRIFMKMGGLNSKEPLLPTSRIPAPLGQPIHYSADLLLDKAVVLPPLGEATVTCYSEKEMDPF